MISQAVILAGGKGTRLSSRLNGKPKPLVDLCGKPLLQHQIELLVNQNFRSIVILTSYGGNQIKEFCDANSNWGINITCVSDDVPLGTAGSVLAALSWLEDNFMVLYGDTMFDINLDRFKSAHFNKCADATIFLHPNDHPFDSDIVEVDNEEWVADFHPYPHKQSRRSLPNLVNAALYCVRKSALLPFAKKIIFSDFGKDLFPEMLRAGYKLAAYKSPEYIKDCGTPERLDSVSSDYLAGKIHASNLKFKQDAIFLDRDGTINHDIDYICTPSQLELLPDVSVAIKNINKSLYKALIITNQPVIARGECTLQGLQQVHNKLESLLAVKHAYLDGIYFCPHHPDKGFRGEILSLKVNCTCRKPNIGLITNAISDFNINVDRSWMVGDTTTDIFTAKNAGLKSVLVETGKGGLDYKYMVSPDYTFPTLKEAIDFILIEYPKLITKTLSLLSNLNGVRVIFVGGQSRSGKSNFASTIKYALKSVGIDAISISIDGWLKNQNTRSNGVKGRYDLEGITEFILNLEQLKNPTKVPIYNKKLGSSVLSSNFECISNNGIVIVEGTLALLFAELISKDLRKTIYVGINENLRMKRFFREYQLRGMDDAYINELYEKRLIDEFDEITQSMNLADVSIDLVSED